MLTVKNITKRFSGVCALEDISMNLHPGKVNAILGENGAGKSTLMKILSGVYEDYEGKIYLKNVEVRFSNPKDARDRGIAIIHQELNLIPYLSITENIYLGRELLNKWGGLNSRVMTINTRALLNKLKLHIEPGTLVNELKIGQQQVVEIAKALLGDSEVIIMDEPTSAISESEVEVLFSLIEDLKKENKTIVYISHKLDELFRIADRFIILRDGKKIDEGELTGMSPDQLINKMVGRNITADATKQKYIPGSVVMEIQKACLKHPVYPDKLLLQNISFRLHKGEILGVFGLMGAGRTELLETIFGLHSTNSSVVIRIEEKELQIRNPDDAIHAGLALVPEDRKRNGLMLGLNVRSNISITTLPSLEEYGLISNKKEGILSGKYINGLGIKTTSDKQISRNLSGGNQQKIVLAKWLATNPRVLMLDEPTRGIDINAKSEIYKLINKLAAEGLGILLVSSELPEIMTLSDRVIVLSEGMMTAEFLIEEATEDKILKAAIPTSV